MCAQLKLYAEKADEIKLFTRERAPPLLHKTFTLSEY
jgi:hypothetical protein